MREATAPEEAENLINQAERKSTKMLHKAEDTAQEVLAVAKDVAEKLKAGTEAQPTNKDLLAVAQKQESTFRAHAIEDHNFQEETRETDKQIHTTLKLILERLDSIEKKMEPLLEIYNGLVFGRKALVWTAGTAVAIGAIAGAVKVFGI